MTALAIIGSSGQLGWELTWQSQLRGMNVHAIDFPDIDIADAVSIRSWLEPLHVNFVINAAAYTAVDRAESEPDKAFAVNRDGAGNLARCCSEWGIPLLHISTDYVFDGSKRGAYLENDRMNPLGVYGRSKAEGEVELRKHLERHVIIRTAWLYGVHGQNFVKTMLKLGRERETLRVVEDQYGCPTYAVDLAGAILTIAAQHLSGGSIAWGTYHFCGGGSTTWHRFAETIFELARNYETFRVKEVTPIGTSGYPTPAQRPANSLLDCSKIEQHFGIRRRHWKESLSEMMDRLYRIAFRGES